MRRSERGERFFPCGLRLRFRPSSEFGAVSVQNYRPEVEAASNGGGDPRGGGKMRAHVGNTLRNKSGFSRKSSLR